MDGPKTLLHTTLLAAHEAAGGRIVPFAGWAMPLDYGSILAEARAVRQSAGLFDVSHMARLRLRGDGAAADLDRALGGAVLDQPVGRARYNLLLGERGTILDDLIAYRLAPDEFLVVANAANRERDLELLRQRAPESEVLDLTEDGGGILALQGPDSRRSLASLCGRDDFCPRFLDVARIPCPGIGTLLAARTGYTGEHGYELFPSRDQMLPLWERLLGGGARPAGLGARDILRLEAGLPLYGHEIHEEVEPFEAGLGFAMKGWQTRDFVGAQALRARSPSERRLVGLLAEKRVPREGYPILCSGRTVGAVCSGGWSPTLNRPIATAYVEASVQGPLAAGARGKEIPLQLTPLPFVPHRSRS